MKKLLLVALMFAFSTSVMAEQKKAYKKMRYGMAGCGLGAMFIDKNTMLPQVGASIVNGWGSQTSAITTGSSNCVDKERDEAKMEQEVFVRVNLAKLTREAAEGQGEYLEALAEVMGCEGNSFVKLSHDRYGKIFSNEDAGAVYQNYVKEIQASELATSCTRVVG